MFYSLLEYMAQCFKIFSSDYKMTAIFQQNELYNVECTLSSDLETNILYIYIS
jgi:hypothetical protein